MEGENTFLTTRNALIATLIAIALNPISIFVGYYLSKELSKPEIKIEYIKPLPEKLPFAASEELSNRLAGAPDILEELKMKVLFTKFGGKNDGGAFKELGAFVQKRYIGGALPRALVKAIIENHQEVRLKYSEALKSTSFNKQVLESNKEVLPSMLKEIDGVEMERLISMIDKNKKNALKALEFYESKIKNDLEVFSLLYEECFQFLNTNWNGRTGKISYEVGFINMGETDGVVYPSGELNFSNFKIPLLATNEEYVVISPHSFDSIIYKINEGQSSSSSLENLYQLVKKHIPEKHSLSVKVSGEYGTQDTSLPIN